MSSIHKAEPHEHDHAHGSELSETELRVRALETILTEKGYVGSNPEYRERLRKDATGAIASMGFAGRQSEHMIAVENTPKIHNMVVCTLCSCYPWAVLGLPPVWYKSAPYRSRAVADPRGVLREFGLELPDETEIRVWDSTAEVRYLVVPMRPLGTEGFSEERLAALVTRDSMIGTGLPKSPAEAP